MLRTGCTSEFSRLPDVDRSPAHKFRALCRSGAFSQPTPGKVSGFVQANLVALPKAFAFDFLLFCLRNPQACPLLDVTEPGDPCPHSVAEGADLRKDVPRYRVWRDGKFVEERTDVTDLWGEDFVGFLLGCSFSWEFVLEEAGLPPRHVEEGRNVPMYKTSVPNKRSGAFGGELVVSMR
eukprot:Cvel_27159.t1-p1 / transcript=Cvel_27159.t1 / gene=Cvel_27159 / organism=Chromera_velia_CCMP2878 / gene_product=UPF0317 protein GK2103, putative / transcript_product=UPF0317 protein GK2103, putative / location=Cvel_scaffold3344:2212-2747(-) / protein_length=178 / sequence_SO=supercontig / SO=protein_coding / is_pseudo=false